jgi:hypothetical protein
MGIGLILMAVGAILVWAVHSTSDAINVDAVGVILMIVGFVGFLLSLFFWSSLWGPGYWRRSYAAAGPAGPGGGRRYVRRAPATAVEEEVIEEGPGY